MTSNPGSGPSPTLRPNLPLPSAVCVVGLGLIGGSLMRAAAPLLPVFGWSPGEATRQAAADDGFEVLADLPAALTRAADSDALVVLAAPVTAFSDLLETIDEVAPTVRLTDVAGVKVPVAEQIAELAPHTRYVGSHPMAGTAHSGWAAGFPELFRDRIWVTTLDDDTALEDWLPVAGLALGVGSRVVPTEAAAHDDAAARISHLPHLLALALAQVGEAGGALALSLAAGSFADGTRVAATRPELVRAMCETNAEYLIPAMDEALALLGVARGSLASSGSLAKIATGGFEARAALDSRFDALQAVRLTGDDMVEQLLAVGAAGGYVTGIEYDAVAGSAPGEALTIHAMYPDGDG